ncbi:prepilin-type N-terminal cleavage/methylation domain-containing protein [Xanthomonas phaseoli pv. dieffenbachiae]|uniref:prepilin-type N-terminal cleavage/methylation domain-containing protein n=1 Tax=Xanthomonas TaxID=338 RepID=UPI001ADB7C3C|nr:MULTISPECIES: prepilin-type N-terminal cleavage/methylation domain-containing protein [Xanthomonas]MBO9898861.1 prepilin-type N-terminal cleavage/methylation domain-containing protein [Xanthomonas phaseoli pv. dieffenbachiae]MCC8612775.1 prepilin-type N-terminal cleavage/methylation domain-containing protein [Xanthomonas euvesicatoria pv. euvesicatoria]CAD7740056.1 hypothetical protein LMG31884_46190 [Xanthomonas hydrangeae]CAD7740060.1 hypothetical protein LMG31884_46190 [Xanthomonas hydran
MKNFNLQRRTQGFTLVELLIVVIILGIIMTIVVMNIVGNTVAARAKMLQRTAQATAQNVNLMSLTCGTSTAILNSPIPASGRTMADVVFGGSENVATAYQTCYTQSSVRSMRDGAARVGNTWQVESYPVTLSGGGNDKIIVTFQNVPDEVVLSLAQRFDGSITALASSDTTSDVVRYTAASSGTRTATVRVN